MPDMQSNKRSGDNARILARIETIARLLTKERGQQFVIDEMNHRTKNLLAVVQAIARQISYEGCDLASFQTQFSQRLSGLSRSMDLFVENGGRGAIVSELVHRQLQPFGNVDGGRISAFGPDLLLTPAAAQNIGLALHELATNAMKYGALSVSAGTVAVSWQVEPGTSGLECFRLTWHEKNGPEVKPPEHAGFGQVVLQRMTGVTLGGGVSHEFHPSGVAWTLEVPATAILVANASASVEAP